MITLYLLVLLVDKILLGAASISPETNSSLSVKSAGFSRCKAGTQYYDHQKKDCRNCRRCRRSPEILDYNLTFSPEFGAIDCYPCYCKPNLKAYNPDTERCGRCPICNIFGTPNRSVEILTDKWHGGMNCIPCVCNKGYFANEFTHHQCTDCLNCTLQNKEVKTPCQQDSDTVCGDCLKGYVMDSRQYCVTDKKTMTSVPEIVSSAMETTSVHIPHSADHIPIIKKSFFITIVVLIIVTFMAACIVYLAYYIINKQPCHNVSVATSAVTSANTISSGSSVNKKNEEVRLNSESDSPSENEALNGNNEHEEDNGTENEDNLCLPKSFNDGSSVYVIVQKGNDNVINMINTRETSL